MNYKQSLDWLESFSKFGIKLGLDRINYLCGKFGNPQKKLNVIHVGGTNGKGSVCRYLASILEKQGYKVGLYLSPHLTDIKERITINQKKISKEDFARLVTMVEPMANKMKKDPPTYFEILTLIAFQYFKEKKVKFAIVEVGLGGRYDATNIVEPLVSIITNISLEHENSLGKKIENIAREKAGIIKPKVPVVTAAKGKGLEVIKKKAEKQKSPIKIVTDSFWKRKKIESGKQFFIIRGKTREYNVSTRMLGEFQGENIAVAVTAAEQLVVKGFDVDYEDITQGVSRAFNPGRMELMHTTPNVLLDGAHNPAATEKLVNSVKSDFEFENLIIVLGVLSDKNVEKIVSLLVPISNMIIATQSSSERALKPDKLADIIRRLGFSKLFVKDNIEHSLDHAFSLAGRKDLILVTGSLFTVAEGRCHPVLRKNMAID